MNLFLKKHWKTIKTMMIDWIIFAGLLSCLAMYLLLQEIQSLRQDKVELIRQVKNMQSWLDEIKKQYPESKMWFTLEK